MNLLSKHPEGDSTLDMYYRKELLDMLSGVNVYFITKQLYKALPDAYIGLWDQGGIFSMSCPNPELGHDVDVEEGCIIISEPIYKTDLVDKSSVATLLRREAMVIHELEHHRQVNSGRLVPIDHLKTTWMGDTFNLLQPSDPGYWYQPWEQEAYLAQASYLNPQNPNSELNRLKELWLSDL